MTSSLLLRALGAVLRATLTAIGNTDRIEDTTNNVIANTRKVLHTTTTNQHNGVLLEVVTLTRDVGSDLNAVGKTDTSHLPQGGVRLLGSGCVHAGTHSPLLRRVL